LGGPMTLAKMPFPGPMGLATDSTHETPGCPDPQQGITRAAEHERALGFLSPALSVRLPN